MLERVADTPTTVLITGESGTGKELVARALHDHSSRKDKPFIKVNCAAIPEELIESELFGYERGAFTGAVARKPGRFELANGGTFLDEIGEIPRRDASEVPARAPRVRVRARRRNQNDARRCAPRRSDESRSGSTIANGGFARISIYRLNVVPMRLPPLRERDDDIPILVEHFFAKFDERLKKHVVGVEPDAIDVLANYSWPGNIRELENVVERAVLFCDAQQSAERGSAARGARWAARTDFLAATRREPRSGARG